ncbi:hypothetical protein BKP37_14650 [Anaerobacillus alkalilacustris]|uniref:Hemolysin n=2 Tax=Anaerobacillus alkalilacustris TaxID=393763 RepID=A0A1S2LHN9_9BACI|nr:hypothetical protein BKP37_14650 [Anaerobacillus alkalilacustris]
MLLLSGYFSASETSITSVNKIRLRSQAENNNVKAKRSLEMAENFDQSLSTILIGNNIVNIAMAAIATKIATDIFGSTGTILFLTTIVLTILVLIFGEILPKSLAKQYAERYLLAISGTLKVVMKIFFPITWVFVQLKLVIDKLFGSKVEEPSVTDEDVRALVEIGEEEGTFLTQERELLHNALEFDDIVVKDILTPRPDVVAISQDCTVEELKDVFIKEKYSRIPVYDGSVDNIVGMISHRDFFTKYVQDNSFLLDDIIRNPYFVIGSVKISNLLKELQKNKVHLAIVLDEYGGTAGIISIEDIIEEIVGEIWDEHDDTELLIEELENGQIRLDGKISVEEFCDVVNVALPETLSNTLSGWISDILGYLPKKGDQVEHENIRIYIEEVRDRRIQKAIVEVSTKLTQTAG